MGAGLETLEPDVVILEEVPAASLPQRTVLTLATGIADQQLKQAAVKFNRANKDNKIKVVEYYSPNEGADFSAAENRLYTEIIAGMVPDMIDFYFVPHEVFTSKGYMEDLYPYLEADLELSADDFLPNLLKAIEADGQLPYLPRSFAVSAVAADRDVVGGGDGWTIQEMIQVVEDNPQYESVFGQGCGRLEFMRLAMRFNGESFYDRAKKSCNFETEEFYRLLEFAKESLSDGGEDMDAFYYKQFAPVMRGEQLLLYFNGISDINSFRLVDRLFNGREAYIGFPSSGGAGNAFYVNLPLGITKSSEHKDIAWSFMRELYLKDSYEAPMTGFPSNIRALESLFELAAVPNMSTSDDGEQIEFPGSSMSFSDEDGQRISFDFYHLTREEADKIWLLLRSIEKTLDWDSDIQSIVADEADAYFNGARTAQETAALIQSRVSLLLNE